jgi:hypothetical protein
MPNLSRKEVAKRTAERLFYLQKGLPVPKFQREKKARKIDHPVLVHVTSKPSGPVAADRAALPESVVREQAYAQAKYDVVQASGNITRPIGRKTFTPLPEFKPAQRVGHDQLGFCQIRRDQKQLSQAQDKVWADAYREGVSHYKETLRPEPSPPSSVHKERNCTSVDRSPLGRDVHVSSVNLAGYGKEEKRQELSPFAPPVVEHAALPLSGSAYSQASEIVRAHRTEGVSGAEKTEYNSTHGTNRRVD